jgi:hypothetical protein
LNFYINRMIVQPVRSASLVKALFLGRQAAKRATVGDPTTATSYDPNVYGGASPIPLSFAQRADFETVLKEAKYI